MIIGKTMSNIGWEIENQYEILSQMISDIAGHYQDDALTIEKEVDEIYNKYSCDYETSSSLTQGYDTALEKQYSFCYEARKILFCAIFSYFESMLYGIVEYYKIDRGRTNQIGQLIDKIVNEYKERFSSSLIVCEETKDTICNKYRPLRNYYMHGYLERDMNLLVSFAKSEECINDKWCGNYEILTNDFLSIALNTIKGFLVNVEEAYDNKTRELWKLNHKC